MLTANLKTSDGERITAPGAIVICRADDKRKGGAPAIGHRYRKLIVESFPLARFGHCAQVRALDNGSRYTIAAHWLEVLP